MQSFFNEPDIWQEPGLYAQRNHLKAWCGYAQVPEGHVLFSADHSSRWRCDRSELTINNHGPIAILIEALHENDGAASLDVILQCHGGITYAGPSYWTNPRTGWWLGFDCSHSGDLTPYDEFHKWSSSGGTYRTLSYVQEQCRELAAQIASFNLIGASPDA